MRNVVFLIMALIVLSGSQENERGTETGAEGKYKAQHDLKDLLKDIAISIFFVPESSSTLGNSFLQVWERLSF